MTRVSDEALRAQLEAVTDPMQQSFVALKRCLGQGDPIEMGVTSGMVPRPLTSVGEYAASIRQAVPAS